MNNQLSISFQTSSPINELKLSGQNKRLYDYLIAGNKINCMAPEMNLLRIGYLNSRTSDLKNKFHLPVKSRFIEVENLGEKTTVKEYWIELTELKQVA